MVHLEIWRAPCQRLLAQHRQRDCAQAAPTLPSRQAGGTGENRARISALLTVTISRVGLPFLVNVAAFVQTFISVALQGAGWTLLPKGLSGVCFPGTCL